MTARRKDGLIDMSQKVDVRQRAKQHPFETDDLAHKKLDKNVGMGMSIVISLALEYSDERASCPRQKVRSERVALLV